MMFILRPVTTLCILAAAGLLGIGADATAAGRPILKCVIDGDVVYTDLPCRDAQRITYELSPRAREREAAPTGQLVYPVHSAEGYRSSASARYVGLNTGRNPECPHLEQRMGLAQAEESAAVSHKSLQMAQERLTVQRKWHRELGC